MIPVDETSGRMNLLKDTPPLPETKYQEEGRYAGFAYSIQGASHRKKELPCQDRCEMRYLKEQQILIAAVADGLGSCSLSHWGAYFAVKVALDKLEQEILSSGAEIDLSEQMPRAFEAARNKVEELADAAHQPVALFQSTLTAVVYRDEQLYCCHVGDDGVVVQYVDGTAEMLTQRMKGEEASSVYPLQTGNWVVTVSSKPVAAFIMATDGVLDHFVFDPRQISYFNGIYYPAVMGPAIYGIQRMGASAAAKACREYMETPSYRKAVEDDLTIVAVVNRKALGRAVSPVFDKLRWEKEKTDWINRTSSVLYAAESRGDKPLCAQEPEQFVQIPSMDGVDRIKEPPVVQDLPKRGSTLPPPKEKTKHASARRHRSSSNPKIVYSDDGLIRIAIRPQTLLFGLVLLVLAMFAARGILSVFPRTLSQPAVSSSAAAPSSTSRNSVYSDLTEQFLQQYLEAERIYIDRLNQIKILLAGEDASAQLSTIAGLLEDATNAFSQIQNFMETEIEPVDGLWQPFWDLHENHSREALQMLERLVEKAERLQTVQSVDRAESGQTSDEVQAFFQWIQDIWQAEQYFVAASYNACNEWILSSGFEPEQVEEIRNGGIDPLYKPLFSELVPFPLWQDTAQQAGKLKTENYNLYIQILTPYEEQQPLTDGFNENT